MNLSYIIPTKGRPSLNGLVKNITSQLSDFDEVIIIADGVNINIELADNVSLINTNYTGNGGSHQRNVGIKNAKGSHLLFLDDDDGICSGAVSAIKSNIILNPDSPHLFRCIHNGHPIWTEQRIRQGDISTQCICFPNKHNLLGVWSDRYESDYDFIRSTIDKYPSKDDCVIWSDVIIAVHNAVIT